GIRLVSSLCRLSRQVGVDTVLLVEEILEKSKTERFTEDRDLASPSSLLSSPQLIASPDLVATSKSLRMFHYEVGCRWRPLSEFFAAIFQYLKSNGDMEETEDSIRPKEDGNTNYPDFKPECVGVFEVISIDPVTILQVRRRDESGS
ncbi:hypothetical protein S245_007467, partial [Arachis hypogaea]